MPPRSLRARLLLGIAAALLAVFSAAGLTLDQGVRRSVQAQIDRELRGKAILLASAVCGIPAARATVYFASSSEGNASRLRLSAPTIMAPLSSTRYLAASRPMPGGLSMYAWASW